MFIIPPPLLRLFHVLLIPQTFIFESSLDSQTIPTHIQAPQWPYILRSFPLKDYNFSKPTISFEP